MTKLKYWMASFALVCLLSGGAQGATIVTGNILEVLDGSGADIGSTVDYWYFTVNSPGLVTIDTLSWEIDSEDRFDSDGDSSEDVDVNGDGEIAFIDPYIYLFNDDGSLDLGDLITSNDDDFTNTYGDGSIYGYDSYISTPLAAGDYVLAIGAYFLSGSEAVAGVNDETFYPAGSNFTNIDHGDYQITFDGDLTVQQAAVPEPASIAIWSSLGALGFLASRRRRKR